MVESEDIILTNKWSVCKNAMNSLVKRSWYMFNLVGCVLRIEDKDETEYGTKYQDRHAFVEKRSIMTFLVFFYLDFLEVVCIVPIFETLGPGA